MQTACLNTCIYFDVFKHLFAFIFTKAITQDINIHTRIVKPRSVREHRRNVTISNIDNFLKFLQV